MNNPCEHCSHYSARCHMCDTDVCPDSVRWLFSGVDPIYFCSTCWTTGTDFRALIDIEEKRHDQALAEYFAGWERAVKRSK